MTNRSRPARRVSSFVPTPEPLERRQLLAAAVVAELGRGALHTNPSELTVVGDQLYFTASASEARPVGAYYWELWRTDGTPWRTQRVSTRFGTPGGVEPLVNPEPDLSEYYGPYGLLAAGDVLWYYGIDHRSSHDLVVSLHRIEPDGVQTIFPLGEVNLSLDRNVHDLRNVGGRIYFYRDGDPHDPDPAKQDSAWWTIGDNDRPAPTGETDPGAFLHGARPGHNNTAVTFDGERYVVLDDGRHGRELWRPIDAPARGVLRVNGTDAPDDVVISSTRRAGWLSVTHNGSISAYVAGEVDNVRAELLGGDDRAVVDESLAPITTPLRLSGGDGDDTLAGASGRDTIYGGAGDDALYGGANTDWLNGDAGNDRLGGGGGRDVLRGGAGADSFVGSVSYERPDFALEDLLR